MKNGRPNDFLETVFDGPDLEYTYNGRRYWTEGFSKDGQCWLVVYRCDDKAVEDGEGYLIYKGFPDCYSKVEYFVNSAIFEGKTFWEVEKDIDWLY